jgi:hypothetical protein
MKYFLRTAFAGLFAFGIASGATIHTLIDIERASVSNVVEADLTKLSLKELSEYSI